jgi:hypothetical protein
MTPSQQNEIDAYVYVLLRLLSGEKKRGMCGMFDDWWIASSFLWRPKYVIFQESAPRRKGIFDLWYPLTPKGRLQRIAHMERVITEFDKQVNG